jgi:hypothetical protein
MYGGSIRERRALPYYRPLSSSQQPTAMEAQHRGSGERQTGRVARDTHLFRPRRLRTELLCQRPEKSADFDQVRFQSADVKPADAGCRGAGRVCSGLLRTMQRGRRNEGGASGNTRDVPATNLKFLQFVAEIRREFVKVLFAVAGQ